MNLCHPFTLCIEILVSEISTKLDIDDELAKFYQPGNRGAKMTPERKHRISDYVEKLKSFKSMNDDERLNLIINSGKNTILEDKLCFTRLSDRSSIEISFDKLNQHQKKLLIYVLLDLLMYYVSACNLASNKIYFGDDLYNSTFVEDYYKTKLEESLMNHRTTLAIQGHLNRFEEEYLKTVLSPEKAKILKDLFKKKYLNDDDYDNLTKCRNILCRKAKIDANEIRIKTDGEININASREKYKRFYPEEEFEAYSSDLRVPLKEE